MTGLCYETMCSTCVRDSTYQEEFLLEETILSAATGYVRFAMRSFNLPVVGHGSGQ